VARETEIGPKLGVRFLKMGLRRIKLSGLFGYVLGCLILVAVKL